jgi:type I restriction enzyme, S subunit
MKQYSEYKDSGVKWMGKIPSHWKAISLKRTVNLINEKTTEIGIPYIALENIEGFTAKLFPLTNIEPDSICNSFKENDILFCKLRPYLTKCILAPFNGKCTSELLVLRNFIGVSKYLNYILISQPLIADINASTYGSKMPRANWNYIGNCKMSFPTITEQQFIVSYLDSKVSKIDRYISTAERKIAALDELKQVTIANAVTHGINPKAPMKDSGIPWIGMVPEHWDRVRYKDVLNIVDEKVGKKNDLTLLSLTKKGIIIRDLSEGKGKFPKDYESYKVVNPNNIILCLFDVDETPRTVGVSHIKGMITGAYDIFEIKNAKLEYIYYLYLSIDDKKGFKSLYKGLRKVIPLPSLLSAYINLPLLSEQNEIVAYIDRKVAQIEKMRASELAQIEKLKEYKQRLISDVVTGKVKVTND